MTTVTDERIAKTTRNLHNVMERVLKGSLNSDDLVLVLAHLVGKGERAKNLIAYARANCPKIDWIDPAEPKARRGRKGLAKMFDEAAFFKTRRGLWVDSDLERYVGIVARSTRGANVLKAPRVLTENENEAKIFGQPGSAQYQKLLDNAADLGQIAELIAAQEGGIPGVLLNNGCANLFAVRGKAGALRVVSIHWDAAFHRWFVYCRLFRADYVWGADHLVFSN